MRYGLDLMNFDAYVDPHTLVELAQAAEAAGKQQKAAQYYAELVKVCAGSNSERPELSRAKGLVAEK